jgi:catechol 2,3-dioxygenase-like lactoylglutathione lyase family enzyme
MISHLDHLVLTTANEAACVDFYTRILGMTLETFIGGTPPVERKAFKFWGEKINLHIKGKEFEPKAHAPTPGALDLCFISTLPLQVVIARVEECQWPITPLPPESHPHQVRFRLYPLRYPHCGRLLADIADLRRTGSYGKPKEKRRLSDGVGCCFGY